VAFVLLPKQPALLQDWNEFLGKQRELAVDNRRHHVEAVGGAGVEPVFNDVGDLFGCAGCYEMPTGARKLAQQLPEGQIFLQCHVDIANDTALRIFDGIRIWKVALGQNAVQRGYEVSENRGNARGTCAG